MPFSIVHQAFGWAGSKNLCPIDRLATNQHIPLNKTENVEQFCESALVKTDPDPVLISAYADAPNTQHRFFLFVLPLSIKRMIMMDAYVDAVL